MRCGGILQKMRGFLGFTRNDKVVVCDEEKEKESL
jgi:hypothetical protein